MHLHLRALAAILFLSALFPTAAQAAEGRYIVQFRDPAAGRGAVNRAGGRVVLDLPAAAAARLPDKAVAALARNPAIAHIEPDQRRYPAAQSVPYGIDQVQAPQAWAGSSGSAVKVCVVDSGVDLPHEDLEASGLSGTPSDWNRDGCGHGTHVTGTIAALDNGKGVVGVHPAGLDVHVVRVFDDACDSSWASSLVAAVEACRDAGAQVVNMSLGGPGHSAYEENAFQDLYAQDGLLLVAAAGNEGTSELSYPASYASVVSVAAVDDQNQRASFSQYNDQVELAAPGVRVLSTYPGGQYGHMSGTSMATPHVSGVAALVWSHDPTWSNVQIRDALAATALDLGPAGRDASFGHGLVQAAAALEYLTPAADLAPPALSLAPVPDGAVAGAPVEVSVEASDPSGVASVSLFYRAAGASTFASVAMSRGAGEAWTGEIPGAAVTPAGVEYYVEAVDGAAAANRAAAPDGGSLAPAAFTVRAPDETPPALSHEPPADPVPEGSPAVVTAALTDATGIGSATLRYQLPDGSWTSTPLAPAGGDVFEGRVPAAAVRAPSLAYRIEAEDLWGNAAAWPVFTEAFLVDVAPPDEAPPVLVHVPVPSEVEAGRAVTVTAEVTDASGLAELTLLWRKAGTEGYTETPMTGGPEYTAEIPAEAVTAEGVEYYLRAVDGSPAALAAFEPADAPATVHRFVGTRASTPDGEDAPAEAQESSTSPVEGFGCAAGPGAGTGSGLWVLAPVALFALRRRARPRVQSAA